MNKTRFPSIFIMIPAWQAHATLSMISESTHSCEGQIGKSKLDQFRPEIEALLGNGSTQKFIANRYGTTEANLHHWMKKHGIKKQKSKL